MGDVSPRFYLVVYVKDVNQEKLEGAGGVQDSPMVDSFFADLPAIESYCIELNLEFCRISLMELLFYVDGLRPV